jgi:hypothetical protein
MSVFYKNKPVPVRNLRELDSCLKKFMQSPNCVPMVIESTSEVDQEKVRAAKQHILPSSAK